MRKRFFNTLILLTLAQLMMGAVVVAQGPIRGVRQEVQDTLRDYVDERPLTYSPTDPNFRSQIFRAHTGHAGWFYNCDNEESKRNSPYICWKTHHELDLPPRRGLWRGAQIDLAEVRQRISDGGCDTGSCNVRSCGCAKCAQSNGACQSCQLCSDGSNSGSGFQQIAQPLISPLEFEQARRQPARSGNRNEAKTAQREKSILISQKNAPQFRRSNSIVPNNKFANKSNALIDRLSPKSLPNSQVTKQAPAKFGLISGGTMRSEKTMIVESSVEPKRLKSKSATPAPPTRVAEQSDSQRRVR